MTATSWGAARSAAVLLSAALAGALLAPTASAAVDIPVSDPNISYVGRWDATGDPRVPHWAGAYLQTGFTGTTVKLKLRNAVNVYTSVDGKPDVFHAGVRGTVDLTPTPLAAGNHTLRVAFRSGDAVFGGLALDNGARTVAFTPSAKVLEFVGDSITAGYLDSKLALSSYGWLVGEKLGLPRTVIARAGYCLVARSGCVGQAAQFFRTDSTGTAGWDFGRYQAAAVVVNLGTNDIGHGVSESAFQSAYAQFLRDVRAKYPNAAIFAFQTLKKRYAAQTKAAVAAVGDARVFFVDTSGWLTTGTDYVDGDGHPNDAGQAKIADRLAPIIAARI
ncbi:SGNH/GDSL hydrolase family protein [Actinosynnema pretiosum subsp. pretiosum]|uniref:SGNH/GDSL hydrolase family protein n=1 Tax=Actinosynnema pretiosum subsp. pretiosum TaxID=103721 RepID=A0AA45R3U0_9PSEU|nr:SGNH/GDSL hydrolase family protein [Actinosynnema pretiosum subsp. pretiosum]